MAAAARENDRRLKGCFGEVLWKVALEPERRTTVCYAAMMQMLQQIPQ